MNYTRKHYINMARLVSALRSEALHAQDVFMLETVDLLTARMVANFERDNPRFQPQRFVDACKEVS